jgi:DNA-binding NarL/FixJ family response regulator
VTPNQRLRVLIVDDHAITREGLATILGRAADIELVGQAGDGPGALEAYRRLQPDVMLIDVGLSGLSGIEVTQALCREFPDARIVILTVHDGDEYVYRALRAGARAYLLKDAACEEVLEAVRQVGSGRRLLAPAAAARLAERVAGSELTTREQAVLAILVEGKSNAAIGRELGITESTVKAHVNNILGKLGVRQRTEAAAVAVRRGLVDGVAPPPSPRRAP